MDQTTNVVVVNMVLNDSPTYPPGPEHLLFGVYFTCVVFLLYGLTRLSIRMLRRLVTRLTR